MKNLAKLREHLATTIEVAEYGKSLGLMQDFVEPDADTLNKVFADLTVTETTKTISGREIQLVSCFNGSKFMCAMLFVNGEEKQYMKPGQEELYNKYLNQIS